MKSHSMSGEVLKTALPTSLILTANLTFSGSSDVATRVVGKPIKIIIQRHIREETDQLVPLLGRLGFCGTIPLPQGPGKSLRAIFSSCV